MEFIKKFFDDDSVKVGLCKFNMQKKKQTKNFIEKELFLNPFEKTKEYAFNFETNCSKNIMLL